ncbi:MAG: pyruvate kinase, partial [Proteobacteria bacterium]|nr:pyruvate kinase [Pseudomonadota bacterium]MBU1610382.1 pyruvate kinase [Pseudomonadota bacterium]
KGINLRAGGLSAGAITDKDREDMRTVAQMNADYVALSFVRSAADVVEARQLLASQGWSGGLLAKIERNEALDRAQEILEVADGIMVARGDLGVEIGDAKLPEAQKRLIRMARIRNRVVITATQMMESMIDSPLPTRAEVFDVANAVLDGTDAVMLSAETAVGRYPSETVVAMGRVCLEAEKQAVARISRHRMDCSFGRVDETIAMSAMYAANHTAITAIAALTESGDTCLWMSRISSGIPIYGLSFDPRSGQRMSLYRGVYPVALDLSETADTEPHELAANELIRRGAVQVGDLVLTTCGDEPGKRGGTNSMHISIIKQRT